MKSKFKKGLKLYIDFNEKEVKELWDLGISKTYEKGELVFNPGSTVDAYFLGSGLTVQYYVNQDGEKIVDHFSTGPDFMAASLPNFLLNQPSNLYCEALTKIEIRILKKSTFLEYSKGNPKLYEMLIARLLQEIVKRQEKRIRDFQMSATEKYQQFQNEYQDSEIIIPSSYLASYLKVEPGSLSRIRKRLR